MNYHIQSVIFDMDGVITNTMPYHFDAWKKIFSDYGIEVSEYDIYKREGQKGSESVFEIFSEHQTPVSNDQVDQILLEKEEHFKKIVQSIFIEGSLEFLKDLKQKDFRLALVTGTARHEMLKMLPQDIQDLFEVTVCGSDIQNGKPHPEPYLTALKKLNLPAQEAVVIENAPFGIQSAKAAGLNCLAIETSLSNEFLSDADMILKSFKDLNSRIKFFKSDSKVTNEI